MPRFRETILFAIICFYGKAVGLSSELSLEQSGNSRVSHAYFGKLPRITIRIFACASKRMAHFRKITA